MVSPLWDQSPLEEGFANDQRRSLELQVRPIRPANEIYNAKHPDIARADIKCTVYSGIAYKG